MQACDTGYGCRFLVDIQCFFTYTLRSAGGLLKLQAIKNYKEVKRYEL